MKIKLLQIRNNMFSHLNNLSKTSIYILLYGLLFCTAYISIASVLFVLALQIDATAALHNYSEVFNYLFMNVVLIIGGALLFDIVIKYDKKNSK